MIKKVLLYLCLLTSAAYSQVAVTPTTTLTHETANNTSAWDGYQADASHNAGAGNINTDDLHILLNDKTITIIGRLLPFWGTSYHPNVGYDQRSYTQVAKQIADARHRGITVLSVDWYGPPDSSDPSYINQTAMTLKQASENLNYKFSLSLDRGALKKCTETSGCSVTSATIRALNYLIDNYTYSTAYQTTNGIPWVWTFDPDISGFTIDWSYVRSHLHRNVYLLFRNEQGFKHAESNGAFAWTCLGSKGSMSCEDGFYYNYTHYYYNKIGIGSFYNGFDDTLATWSTTKRYQDQLCGTLWLKTINEANIYPYFQSLGHPIHFIQVASWNDYEEGHSIETGTRNCLNLQQKLSGSSLTWNIGTANNYYTGEPLDLQSTLSKFVVFVSTDGENLMPLVTLPASARSIDLSQYVWNPGTYYFYVKAVGKPSIVNHMSAKGTMTVASAGLSVASPVANTTYAVNTSVNMSATSTYPTTARIEVWINYKKVITQFSGNLNSYYTFSTTGSKRIAFRAIDSSGNVLSTVSMYVNIK